ncbi:diacylglycerol kinase [Gallaecimonas xiamenensis]|uniref:Diacylglycerol kinase n=1 Tax=Gallaecimonas xiamenensis 3-C-1 TaxID=745411 RepID=K2IQ35_9GAMM|nr:diacylglycerol kinase [Gallaecimonas xiamenensis]EKE72251.1 diacylglycerol kinase [Gallaecimonas xiamenensis 3-C-1]
MKQHGRKGVARIKAAAGYSIKGLLAAWRNEEAFRQESLLMLLLLPLGLWLGQTWLERAILVVPLFVVLLAELLNSAIEAVVDRIGPEHHELSGRAKDIGSAAVFVSLTLVVLVWGLALWPLAVKAFQLL